MEDREGQRRIALVWSLPSATLAGGLLGAFVDSKAGTAPWCTIGFALLGFSGSVVQLLRAPKPP